LSGYSPISPNETERIAQIERIRRMKQQADNHGE
jgi:lipoate-protein ligase A